MLLEINRKKPGLPSRKFLEKVVFDTIKYSKYSFLKPKEMIISLASVSKEEIKKINKKYRGRDAATDILSMSDYESKGDLIKENETAFFLGELIICCDYIKKSAKINNTASVSFKSELAKIVSHGTLHLLGFHHGKKMFSIQDKVSRSALKL
jgi:probable rRNA maturation factor